MHHDDDDHSGHQHGFVVVNMEDTMARQKMAHDSALHGIMRFVHELEEEQLEAFAMLMYSLTDPRQSVTLASKFEGIARQVLHFKHGWCACGERHGLVEDLLSDMNPDNVGSPHPHGTGEEYSEPGKLDLAAYEAAMQPGDIEQAAANKKATLMAQYNMIESEGKLLCKLCGTQFISLRDRMLREPDDCSGCRMKNAQG